MRTQMKYETISATREHNNFVDLFGREPGAAEASRSAAFVEMDLNLNKYRRLMADYSHRKRFRRTVVGS